MSEWLLHHRLALLLAQSMVRSAYTLPSVLTPSLPAGFPNCRPPFSNCFSKSLFEGGKPSRFSLVWKCPHFVFVLDRQFCGCTTLGRLTDLPTALQTYLVAARLPTVSCHEQIVIPPSFLAGRRAPLLSLLCSIRRLFTVASSFYFHHWASSASCIRAAPGLAGAASPPLLQ